MLVRRHECSAHPVQCFRRKRRLGVSAFLCLDSLLSCNKGGVGRERGVSCSEGGRPFSSSRYQ